MDAMTLSAKTTIWHDLCKQLVSRYDIMFAANLLNYDHDMHLLHQALKSLKSHEFAQQQKIIFSLYDTDYYLPHTKVGLTTENLLKILEDLDISLAHCYLFTNHHGLHDALIQRCKQWGIKVFENNFSTGSARLQYVDLPRTSDQIKKKFCYMSNLRRNHRSYIRLWIHDRNLYDSVVMAWHAETNLRSHSPSIKTENRSHLASSDVSLICTMPFTRLNDKIPVSDCLERLYLQHRSVLDVQHIDPCIYLGPNQDNFWASWLDQTFVNIVAETVFDFPYPYLTEKTFKCFWHRSPFIMVGAAHSLRYLKKIGFQTFEPWIDESYDSVTDPTQRLECLLNTLDSISEWSLERCRYTYNEMIPVLDHNLLHYQNYFCQDLLHQTQKNI